MITRGKSGIRKPKAYNDIIYVDNVTKPASIQHALNDLAWFNAMK